MEKCKIGADELILWLRKNGIANNTANDGTNGLGQRIRKIIEDDLDGERIPGDYNSFWASLDTDRNIGKFNLPKTSAQYFIDFENISKLYIALSEL